MLPHILGRPYRLRLPQKERKPQTLRLFIYMIFARLNHILKQTHRLSIIGILAGSWNHDLRLSHTMKLSKKFKLPHIFRISIELRQKSMITFKKAYFKIEAASWCMLSSCLIDWGCLTDWASSNIKAASQIETVSWIEATDKLRLPYSLKLPHGLRPPHWLKLPQILRLPHILKLSHELRLPIN